MQASQETPSTVQLPHGPIAGKAALDVADLLEKARTDADTVLGQLNSRLGGLSEAEASLA
jgi:hypothetical protein